MQEDFMFFPPPQQQQEEEEIDERINISDLHLQKQQEQQPLQSPDLLKYYYMTQLLRARNSPGNTKGYFEDWMFKEQVFNAHIAAITAAAASSSSSQQQKEEN
jgi:hypothetical protein